MLMTPVVVVVAMVVAPVVVVATANAMVMPRVGIITLVNSHRRVTGDTATRIGDHLGTATRRQQQRQQRERGTGTNAAGAPSERLDRADREWPARRRVTHELLQHPGVHGRNGGA